MQPARPKPAFRTSAVAQSARSAVKALWWTAAGRAAQSLVGPQTEALKSDHPRPSLAGLRRAYFEAFTKDARDIAAGLYPAMPDRATQRGRAIAQTADFLNDARQVEARRRRGGGTEARDLASSPAYPTYYKQNFHFQSGGWFTADSAKRYDAQVEALFSGAAAAMRRRVLSVLMRGLAGQDQRGLKVVDLACGTGGFLRDLKAALPRAHVSGLDLSPAYAQQARAVAGASVVQANMERLPYGDGSLDAVTCIYLFHELPPRLRPLIASEMARVLEPGGLLALGDSIQPQDAPGLARLLDVFPALFHEPFYQSYAETDLVSLFADAKLEWVMGDQAFLTKALLFRKAAQA